VLYVLSQKDIRKVTDCISGCIALARSHLGTVTSLDERTGVVSKGSMAQAAGFIIGPGEVHFVY